MIDETEEDISELDPLDSVLHDPPISPEDKMMSGDFCFVQTEDGKVVEVNYPDGESSEAINFKKGIAAAFQTNFKGTTQEEEEDTTSLHQSTYRYVDFLFACKLCHLSITCYQRILFYFNVLDMPRKVDNP